MFGCQTAPDFTHRGCEGWMIEAAAAPSHPSLSLHPHLRPSRLWSLWPRAGWWEGLRCQPWLWVSWTQTAAPVCGDFYKVNVQFMFLRTTKTNSKPLVFVQKTKIYTKIKHRLFLRISHKNSVLTWETGSRRACGASATLLRTCRLAAFTFCPPGSRTVTYRWDSVCFVGYIKAMWHTVSLEMPVKPTCWVVPSCWM